MKKSLALINIVLVSPQIPQNTGNIARTCAVTGARLTLVRPLGFTLSDRSMKRSGLDYWEGVDVEIIDDLYEWLKQQSAPFFFFSTKGTTLYSEVCYPQNAILIFGSETSGLPEKCFTTWPEHFVTLPMRQGQRSLNLSNTVAIAVYEACRQNHFASMTP